MRQRFARGSASTSSLSGTAGGSATHQHVNTSLTTLSAGGHNHSVDVPSQSITGGSHEHAGPSHSHTGPDHSHTGPLHAHNVNIGEEPTTSAGGHTSHGGPTGQVSVSSGTSATAASVSHTHNSSAGSHSHNYNPPSTTSSENGAGGTGLAGTGNTGLSGTASTTGHTSHTHTLDPAAFSTTGGEGAHTHGQGTSDSISNIPPYIDINYIVKI